MSEQEKDVPVDVLAMGIAEEAVATFSKMHPHIRMNVNEWDDLREVIEREIRGTLGGSDVSARDLLPGNETSNHSSSRKRLTP